MRTVDAKMTCAVDANGNGFGGRAKLLSRGNFAELEGCLLRWIIQIIDVSLSEEDPRLGVGYVQKDHECVVWQMQRSQMLAHRKLVARVVLGVHGVVDAVRVVTVTEDNRRRGLGLFAGSLCLSISRCSGLGCFLFSTRLVSSRLVSTRKTVQENLGIRTGTEGLGQNSKLTYRLREKGRIKKRRLIIVEKREQRGEEGRR
ncbi:hypothetical protein F4824DRAFT_462602 [Ustulina deusta]|nr:hypothetical protein F4824DRAFT_462602 [Ustulina deusta]